MHIDDVDQRIVALLNDITQVVEGIGAREAFQRAAHLRTKHEDGIYANVTGSNQGPMSPERAAPHLRAHH